MRSDTVHFGYNEIMQAMDAACARHPELCARLTLGATPQGRAIPAVVITAPQVAAELKQHVLVIAGQHGNEESGRAIALALVEFLLSDTTAAAEILKTHVVAVAPCANPDGAMRSTANNGDNMDVTGTFELGKPAATSEGRALETFALEFAPEVVVDLHGMAGGCMRDRVWLPRPLGFTPDRYFQTVMAMAMNQAAETAGFPQCEVEPPEPFKVDETRPYTIGIMEKLAVERKSLAFGPETIELYYKAPAWRADGMAKLRALFKFGGTDAFHLGEPGYPASLVSGSGICGLKAHGVTAAARRTSRVELTRFLRDNYTLVNRLPDGPEGCCRVKIESMTMHGQNPERFAVLLRLRKPCVLGAVSWEGALLQPGDDHGYRTWEYGPSVCMQVNLRAPFGGPARHIAVAYESPCLVR